MAELDSSFSQMETRTISEQKAVASFASDPESHGVAHNGAEDSGADHKPDVQVLASASVNCRGDQDCFTRKGQSQAFQSDDQSYHPIAIGGDEME